MKLWRKIEGFIGCKFLVVRRDGTVPAWPHFVMGARDPAVPPALRAYAYHARRLGKDPEYCQSVLDLADDFDRHRNEHGEGDPDVGPHRKDDPEVIRAMQGEPAIINAFPDKVWKK